MDKYVGSSAERTPYKHAFLNRVLGMQVGAGSRLSWLTDHLFIDACAGDGARNAWSGTSNPEIFRKHVGNSRTKPTRCYLIEQSDYGFAHLHALMAGEPYITVLHGDYRSAEVAHEIGPSRSSTGAFLHIDPNHADDVELSTYLRNVLPSHTLILCTLGYNAHGIKRLPLEQRRLWFERVEHLLVLRRASHDACLVSLEKDNAQWAYLLTTPEVWRKRIHKIATDLGREYWTKGVRVNWLSDGEKEFWDAANRLFLKVDGSERR